MGNKIIIRTTPSNRITVKSNLQKGSIKEVGVITTPQGAENLIQLKDVDATRRSNTNTLVYDAGSDKFIVRELPIINGGDF